MRSRVAPQVSEARRQEMHNQPQSMPRKPSFYLPGMSAHVVQRGKETISRMWQYLGRQYVMYVNQIYGRS